MINLDLYPKWLLPNRDAMIEALSKRCLQVMTYHEGRTYVETDSGAIFKLRRPMQSFAEDEADGDSNVELKRKRKTE